MRFQDLKKKKIHDHINHFMIWTGEHVQLLTLSTSQKSETHPVTLLIFSHSIFSPVKKQTKQNKNKEEMF